MIIKKEDFNFENFKKNVLEEKVFVYPTDTIYGLGCDATNFKAVNKIRNLKNRDKNPFSIAAPDKEWIKENCFAKSLDRLPGPYTLILKKRKDCVADNVSFNNTLGVRIPDNWFKDVVKELKIPIVSTSVNLTGEKPMRELKDLKLKVDFIIYEGKLNNNPSTIITDKKIKKRE